MVTCIAVRSIHHQITAPFNECVWMHIRIPLVMISKSLLFRNDTVKNWYTLKYISLELCWRNYLLWLTLGTSLLDRNHVFWTLCFWSDLCKLPKGISGSITCWASGHHHTCLLMVTLLLVMTHFHSWRHTDCLLLPIGRYLALVIFDNRFRCKTWPVKWVVQQCPDMFHPKYYALGWTFVLVCRDIGCFIHTLQGHFIGGGVVIRLLQYAWINPVEYW